MAGEEREQPALTPRRPSAGSALVRAAAALGLLNALPSYYWAFGGEWMIATIGQWLILWRDQSPVAAGAALLLIAVVKTAAAILPVVVHRRRWRPVRSLRTLCWIIVIALVVYGAAGASFSLSVLGGLIEPSGSVDTVARMGHAFLWHPMLLLWGCVLGLGLRLSSSPTTRE